MVSTWCVAKNTGRLISADMTQQRGWQRSDQSQHVLRRLDCGHRGADIRLDENVLDHCRTTCRDYRHSYRHVHGYIDSIHYNHHDYNPSLQHYPAGVHDYRSIDDFHSNDNHYTIAGDGILDVDFDPHPYHKSLLQNSVYQHGYHHLQNAAAEEGSNVYHSRLEGITSSKRQCFRLLATHAPC